MSMRTPRWLRRAALVSIGSGVLLVLAYLLFGWLGTGVEWDESTLPLSYLLLFVSWLGCASIVFAGNALAWSIIVPRLPTAEPKRAYVATAITTGFSLVSIALTFTLLLLLLLGPGLVGYNS